MASYASIAIRTLIIAAISVLAVAQSACQSGSDPRDIVFPYTWGGNIDTSRFREPSGIVFHPGRKTLFVVGDEGDVCEMTTEGHVIRESRIGGEGRRDLEGITCNPATGMLYAVVEGEERIVEIDPGNLGMVREFIIDRVFDGDTVIAAGGQGIEVIAFAPDAEHPEGGTFYVANQSFGLDNKNDRSIVFEVVVPLSGRTAEPVRVSISRYFSLGVVDLSGMSYAGRCLLRVTSDATNTLWEVTTGGGIVRSYALPGENQEGIAVDDSGAIYIAQDSGGIVRFRAPDDGR